MTSVFIMAAQKSANLPQLDISGHIVWLLAGPDAASAFGKDIEPYGYSILRLDPRSDVVPRADLPEPEMVVVDAFPDGPPITTHVGDAAALPGRPGVIVIDHGLDPIDRILALEAGADDCVAWPCPAREFIARMRAVSRRVRPSLAVVSSPTVDAEPADQMCFAGWTLDRRQRRLAGPQDKTESLSAAEFAVLDVLLREPRSVISREALLEATASMDGEETRTVRTVDIQISRLRKRLASDGDEIIRTVRGSGYMLVASVTSG